MKILLTAYLDNNLGDDLMIRLLAEQFTEYDFYLNTNKTVVKNTFKTLHNVHFNPKVQPKYDAYVTIGGSMFAGINIRKRQLSRISRLMFLFKLKRNKIKRAIVGCNLEEKKSRLGYLITKLELKMFNLITVRDKYSYELLKQMKGFDNFFLAEDIVYQLNPEPFKQNNKQCLGISAYRSMSKNENNLDNYLTLARISDEFINKTGKSVKLFCFDTENENDLSAAHHIYNFAKNKTKISIIPYLGNINEFLKEFSSCEKMIAIRFHSAVLSEVFNIPFVPVAYSNKMANLMIEKGFSRLIKLNDLTVEKTISSEFVDNLISGLNTYYPNSQININSSLHFEKLKIFFDSIKFKT